MNCKVQMLRGYPVRTSKSISEDLIPRLVENQAKPGTVFERLTVVEEIGHIFTNASGGPCRHRRLIGCVCVCGRKRGVYEADLVKGCIVSCGCKDRQFKSGPGLGTGLNRVLQMYKKGARKRGHEWTLDNQEFLALVRSNCLYCGACPSNRTEIRSIRKQEVVLYTGIDRIDNTKGYTCGNSVPCCRMCNYGKREYSYQEFSDWIDRVAANKPKYMF